MGVPRRGFTRVGSVFTRISHFGTFSLVTHAHDVKSGEAYQPSLTFVSKVGTLPECKNDIAVVMRLIQKVAMN
jgi:hypothetical protein